MTILSVSHSGEYGIWGKGKNRDHCRGVIMEKGDGDVMMAWVGCLKIDLPKQ